MWRYSSSAVWALRYTLIPQIGPFTFFQNQMMINCTWSADGDVIKYIMWTYYTPAGPLGPEYSQNVTTVRLPFMLFDALGLGSLLGDFLETTSKYTAQDLMFVNQPVADALWGADDAIIASLLEDFQYFLNAINSSIVIPINQFAQAPGFYTNITTYDDALQQLGYITMYTGEACACLCVVGPAGVCMLDCRICRKVHEVPRAGVHLVERPSIAAVLFHWNLWRGRFVSSPLLSLPLSLLPPSRADPFPALRVPSSVWDDARPTWLANGTVANRVHGTNGDQFRFNLSKGDVLPTFVDSLYR